MGLTQAFCLYVVVVYFGPLIKLLKYGNGTISEYCFLQFLDTYFSYLVTLQTINIRVGAQSYVKLICHVLMKSMGYLQFCNQKERVVNWELRTLGRRDWQKGREEERPLECKINKQINSIKLTSAILLTKLYE